MAGRATSSRGGGPGGGGPVVKQLVQTLRGDLNLLSNEARKKYPAVREVSGRHSCRGCWCTCKLQVCGLHESALFLIGPFRIRKPWLPRT